MKVFLLFSSIIVFTSCNFNTKKTSEGFVSKNNFHSYRTDSTIHSPIKFHPNIVSTEIDKFNTSFSPNGDTIYYTVTSQKLGLSGIAFQKFIDGNFLPPEFVPFSSADIPVADVQISPDGKSLFFSTFKDYQGKPEGFNFNIWVSKLINGKWQEPEPLGYPISSTGNEFYPVITTNKTIYFNSDRNGNSDIYYSKYENNNYQEPIKLPDNINSDKREADAFIARDESYIIFVRVDEPEGFGNSDLYISFNEGNGKWTNPTNMGENVNSNQIDGSPYITPDGKYLIFTSGRQQKNIKEKAIKSYAQFKAIATSSDNGSLNFYIMSFNPNNYR